MNLITAEEMTQLADDIETSEGIAIMSPIGPIQIGFRRTAALVDILRRTAEASKQPDAPHG